MRLHIALLLLGGATLAAIAAAALIHQHNLARVAPAPANQVFVVTGRIRSCEANGKTVRIAHEEIPGFMPAMEMPFTVKEPAELRGLAPGDTVRFQLVVTKDDSWITGIEKLPASARTAAAEAAPGEPAPSTTAEPQRIKVGEIVPDFSLTDQDGHPFRLQEFRGKAVVLTFIYTRCPLPNFCPLMSRNFASLQERFAREFPHKVRLLSISFDPQFDTPARLKQYAAAFQKDAQDWTFATGTRAQVDSVTGLFGLIREPDNGFINHDLRTALIGPDGKLVHVWRSNVWTPDEVQSMVREVFQSPLASWQQVSPREARAGRAAPSLP